MRTPNRMKHMMIAFDDKNYIWWKEDKMELNIVIGKLIYNYI